MLHDVFILSLNYAIYMAILFSDRETERYWKKQNSVFNCSQCAEKPRYCKLNGLCLKGYGSDYRGPFCNKCTWKFAFDADNYLYKQFLKF